MNQLPERIQYRLSELEKHPLWIDPAQSVEDSKRFGWMRGIALKADTEFEGRWYEWLLINARRHMDDPYQMPETVVTTDRSRRGIGEKMLENCMKWVYAQGHRLWEFIEWIGYGLGIAWFKAPKIPDRLWQILYETFDIRLLIKEPADYFSHFIGEHGQSGHLDYFPTPIDITKAINMMVFADNDDRTSSQYEPCIGAGAMVLPSRSLNLVGADLSLTMVKVASIQAFLYMPSLLYVPGPIIGLHADPETLTINKYFEFKTNTRIYWGNSLLGEHKAPVDIFDDGSEWIEVFLSPYDLRKREIFEYDEYMFQSWDSLPYDLKVQIVAAQARELGFDIMTTNPPFNARLGKFEKQQMDEIKASNETFWKERQQRLEQLKKLHENKEEIA
jgi:GNAT superfamily N-acetyltransferase